MLSGELKRNVPTGLSCARVSKRNTWKSVSEASPIEQFTHAEAIPKGFRAKERLARVVGEDLDQAVATVETRANALVNGKNKDKEKIRQQILKALA
jgi:hypothetical protein